MGECCVLGGLCGNVVGYLNLGLHRERFSPQDLAHRLHVLASSEICYCGAMGRRRRAPRNGKDQEFWLQNLPYSPRKGAWHHTTEPLDSLSLCELIGEDLYNRVMQWNDSGAVDALLAAQERRQARRIGRPCWVPKIKDDLYIGKVDWDQKESEELCDIPQSADALAEELYYESQETTPAGGLEGAKIGEQSAPLDSPIPKPGMDGIDAVKPSGWGELGAEAEMALFPMDSPTLVEAVLEDSTDGQRLIVGGWPVEPSGWDQVDTTAPQLKAGMDGLHVIKPSGWGELGAEAHMPLFPMDSPTLVEAVLEDSTEGQRLLVGGWPIEPSGWDQVDTPAPQLKPGMDGLHVIKPSGWGELGAEALFPMDSPIFVEAVLEDSIDGQRLIVGGWPIEPSGWDQVDTIAPQLGCDSSGLHIEARAKSGPLYYPGHSYGFYEGSYLAGGHRLGQDPSGLQIDAKSKSGWEDPLWHPGNHSSFYQGNYMTAF